MAEESSKYCNCVVLTCTSSSVYYVPHKCNRKKRGSNECLKFYAVIFLYGVFLAAISSNSSAVEYEGNSDYFLSQKEEENAVWIEASLLKKHTKLDTYD